MYPFRWILSDDPVHISGKKSVFGAYRLCFVPVDCCVFPGAVSAPVGHHAILHDASPGQPSQGECHTPPWHTAFFCGLACKHPSASGDQHGNRHEFSLFSFSHSLRHDSPRSLLASANRTIHSSPSSPEAADGFQDDDGGHDGEAGCLGDAPGGLDGWFHGVCSSVGYFDYRRQCRHLPTGVSAAITRVVAGLNE